MVSEEIELSHKKQWHGRYRGIQFEISNWELGEKPAWAYYLHLCLQQFPKSVQPFLIGNQYFTQFGTALTADNKNPLNSLNWHCGMTWNSAEWNVHSVFSPIKVGCDYQHYWDQDNDYSERFLLMDVKECIDSLYVQHPMIRTMDELWDEWRTKFPGNKTKHRWFDRDAKEMECPY